MTEQEKIEELVAKGIPREVVEGALKELTKQLMDRVETEIKKLLGNPDVLKVHAGGVVPKAVEFKSGVVTSRPLPPGAIAQAEPCVVVTNSDGTKYALPWKPGQS